MEFNTEEYKRRGSNVFTSADGFKYVQSKTIENGVYLKCAIFRNGCKGTAKLNLTRHLISLKHLHNHDVSEYKAGIYQLKAKCKTLAKQTQSPSLRSIFDDATRNEPNTHDVSFPECESAMYRSRKTYQPKIPSTATEFIDMLGATPLGKHFKFSVTTGNQVAVVFFSDEIQALLVEASSIQFDGTFDVVPIQFYQLWTIFISVGRHTVPAIHCLMTAKSQELYSSLLEQLVTRLPEFKPVTSMSDWERAPRNAIAEVFPHIRVFGCFFHYTQCIWAMVQKLGLVQDFKKSPEISKYTRLLMAIPFLPASLISPTFILITTPNAPTLDSSVGLKLEKLKKYIKKHWLTHISPEELSIFEVSISSNNGAESYHAKLKARIRSSCPRIWTFTSHLNDIIIDTDNDIGRIRQGREISRARKLNYVQIDDRRKVSKEKLLSGEYTPWQDLQHMSNTIGSQKFSQIIQSESEDSEEELEILHSNNGGINCSVCLNQRLTTWIFMPCRHATFCADCSQQIMNMEQTCPICRNSISERLQIYT